jgi:hypothetical protein
LRYRYNSESLIINYAKRNAAWMIKLTFSKFQLKLRQQSGVNEVFDMVRKKWLLLSPEEWVRQNLIHFLLSKKYPLSLIAIEKEIKIGELSRRCDIVVYSRDMQPFMIIECKEMKVDLSEKTLKQVLHYHSKLQPKYLIITNGSYCFGFKKIDMQFIEIDEFPGYEL